MFLDKYDFGIGSRSGNIRSANRHNNSGLELENNPAPDPEHDGPATSCQEVHGLAGPSRFRVWNFGDWLPARHRHSEKRFEEYRAMVETTRLEYMSVVIVLLILLLVVARTPVDEGRRMIAINDWLLNDRADEPLLIDELNAIVTARPPRENDRRHEGAADEDDPIAQMIAFAPAPGFLRSGGDQSEPAGMDQSPPPLTVPPATPELIPLETRIEKLQKRPPLMTSTGAVLSGRIDMPEFVGREGDRRLLIHYPEAARARLIEGRTVISFKIQPDGRATNVGVLLSSHPLLDSAAVRAIRGTMFKPALQEGSPIAMDINLPINFRLMGF